jgi:hypothetical protein
VLQALDLFIDFLRGGAVGLQLVLELGRVGGAFLLAAAFVDQSQQLIGQGRFGVPLAALAFRGGFQFLETHLGEHLQIGAHAAG